MYFHEHLKETVKDVIDFYNGNVMIYAVGKNDKLTYLQKKSWAKYENDKKFSDHTHPFTGKTIIYVIKK